MPPPSLVSVLRHLRRTAGAHAGIDDAALLERFAADRDEAAFELLVWRHGPMVLGVCNRRLGNVHAAEDAFQATFLALARRAKSIRRQASVAGWLYRVAGRVALAARERNARRSEQPLDGMTPPGREPEPADAVALHELRQALDDAVGRLPARYRDPLVLTCFSGRSHAEAAQQLGCAVRTIESRLGRARQRLRAVLLRRGFLPAGGLAAALVPADAPAGVATSLVMATVRAVGKGAVSSSVKTLTEGVLHAMLLSKIKIAGAVMFVAGFVGLGTGGWVYQSRAVGQDSGGEPKANRPARYPTNPVKDVGQDKQVQKQRVRELLRELDEALKDDTSVETAQQIEKLLKAAADRQREQQEHEITATLATIAADIARLGRLANGDKDREKAVVEFKAYFDRLKESFRRRFAVEDLVVPTGKFSAGFGLRGFEFGSAANPAANDPIAPKHSGVYDKTNLQVLGEVDSVNGRQVTIKRVAGEQIKVGQILSAIRIRDDARYIGKVKVVAVSEHNALGGLTELAWRQSLRAGDSLGFEYELQSK